MTAQARASKILAMLLPLALLSANAATASAQTAPPVGDGSSKFKIDPSAPAATTRTPVSNAPYVAIAPGSRVSAVASRLLEVLINAGYPDQAWFVLVGHDERPRGAAVFTSLEVINEEGNRASVPYEPSEFHKLIFGAPAQHVRRFAFYLSDLPLTSMPQPEVTPDTLDTPFSNGARTPAFPELETINASHYELVAYVYVFKKSPLTGELTLIREASGNLLNAKAHLTAAGLWRALGYSD